MFSTRFVTGSPNWADHSAPDIAGANAFYSALFGWAVRSAEEFGGYVTYLSDGEPVAGGMGVPEEEGPAGWALYFQTPDADATAKVVKEAGGTAVLEPMDVGDLGRMSLFADPAGAGFGTWQPGVMKGFGRVMETNSLVWAELYTPDTAAAASFYGTALGLRTFDVEFPGGTYTTLYAEDTNRDDMFAGLVPQDSDPSEAGEQPYWLPYFAVDDCDATAAKVQRLGGKVRVEPMDIPDVGRMAKFADPYGAKFAVLKPEPRHG